MTTVAESITQISYELRNDAGEFTSPELLAYHNRVCEILHFTLVRMESDLVRTGTCSFVTVAGTQSYDLTAASPLPALTDFLIPHRVWVSTYPPMDMCEEIDLYEGINEEEDSQTGHRAQPYSYCILNQTMWFKEVPDAVYTIEVRYFPNFATLAATSADIPHHGLFDQAIAQSVILLAKNRDDQSVSLEGQLMSMIEAEALKVLGRRTKIQKKITVKVRQ